MRPLRKALLVASRSRWLADRVPRYPFARRAVRRFMPGEKVDDAVAAARKFTSDGISTVLTHLGENVVERSAANAVEQHYEKVLERVCRESLDAHISVKLTQLGLDIDPALAEQNVRRLVELAAQNRNTVWIDIEQSSYTDRTIALFRAVATDHPNVGLCLQAYLRRTNTDLEALLPLTAAIRLVKGAYDEPPTIAFPKKRDVDANYLRLAVRLVRGARAHEDRPVPGLGTHDLSLLQQIISSAETGGVRRDEYEIQMLYGIRSREQVRMARDGHKVRVLISYGEAWFPWYVRRLAERPANIGFVIRSLAMK
jgi:proline dehydrogenase